MDIDGAIARVQAAFPVPGYMDGAGLGSYRSIALTVEKYLPQGGRILDFGCGPMDKTAVIRELGYTCAGFDDLNDPWHSMHKAAILDFARHQGIDFRESGGRIPFAPQSFDMVMMHDVIEHLHDSPRELLGELIGLLKEGGCLFITVPNAANIRKRLALLRGGTNMMDFAYFFWYPPPWRGHVREYVKSDLSLLAAFLGLQIRELRTAHHMIHRVPARARPVYRAVTAAFPGWRDTWMLVAQKPPHWSLPILDAEQFKSIRLRVNPFTPVPVG